MRRAACWACAAQAAGVESAAPRPVGPTDGLPCWAVYQLHSDHDCRCGIKRWVCMLGGPRRSSIRCEPPALECARMHKHCAIGYARPLPRPRRASASDSVHAHARPRSRCAHPHLHLAASMHQYHACMYVCVFPTFVCSWYALSAVTKPASSCCNACMHACQPPVLTRSCTAAGVSSHTCGMPPHDCCASKCC